MGERLIWRCAADIEIEPIENLLLKCIGVPDVEMLAAAIAWHFRDSHEHSRINILSRYCRDGMPIWLACIGVMHDYSSAIEWRRARRIHRRLKIRQSDFVTPRH